MIVHNCKLHTHFKKGHYRSLHGVALKLVCFMWFEVRSALIGQFVSRDMNTVL